MGVQIPSRASIFVAAGLAAFLPFCALAGPIEDMSPGTWYEVPNSQLKSVDPCPNGGCSWSANEGQSAVIDDWNGAAFASSYGTKGAMLVWGGGHSGYFGNEVYAFDVGALQWRRLSEPVANGVCNYAEAELQDGSPCSSHNYDGLEYHPGSNSFVILGAAGSHDGITGSPRVHLFNLGTSKWRRGASFPGGAPWGSATAYDAVRDVFWIVPAFNQPFAKYDPDAASGAGQWTTYATYNIDTGTVGSIDPTRDLFVVIDGAYKHQLVVFDLKNPGVGVVVPVSGDTTPLQQPGNGFDWDPVAKAFVAWVSGSSVYAIRPPTSGDWRTNAWTITRVTPAASNTVTPTARNMNNPYSHWRYVPAVNAWMIVNRNTDNVFFYKMSAGAGVRPNAPANVSAQ